MYFFRSNITEEDATVDSIGYIIAVIVIILIGNFYVLVIRPAKNRRPVKKARDNDTVIAQQREIYIHRQEREQEEAARRVALQNRTLELYDQVRKQAKSAENEPEAEEAPGDDLN